MQEELNVEFNPYFETVKLCKYMHAHCQRNVQCRIPKLSTPTAPHYGLRWNL